MARVRCPFCRTKVPAAGEMFMRIPAPGTDSCPKCGADLLQPALDKLEKQHWQPERTPEEVVRHGVDAQRFHTLLLRAQLHERMRQTDRAERDRKQAIDELTLMIIDQQRVGGEPFWISDLGARELYKLRDMYQWRGRFNEESGRPVEATRDALRALDLGDAGDQAAALKKQEKGYVFTPLFSLYGPRGPGPVRRKLMEEGKAVCIGYCEKCGKVGDVTFESDQGPGRCPAGHVITILRCVVPEDAERAAAEVITRVTGHTVGEPPDDADVAVEVAAMPRPDAKPYAMGKNRDVCFAIGTATAPGAMRRNMAAVYVGDALAGLPARFGNLKGAQARELVTELKAKGAEARAVVVTGDVIISRPQLDLRSGWATLVMDTGDLTHAVPEGIYELAKEWVVRGKSGPLTQDQIDQVLDFAWKEAGNLLDRLGYMVVWGNSGYDKRGRSGYDIVRATEKAERLEK